MSKPIAGDELVPPLGYRPPRKQPAPPASPQAERWEVCPRCKLQIPLGTLARHLGVHARDMTTSRELDPPDAARPPCPHCGRTITASHLMQHIRTCRR